MRIKNWELYVGVIGLFALAIVIPLSDALAQNPSPSSNTKTSSNSVIQLALGAGYTIVLKDNGTLWGWGDNRFGQLGTGDTKSYISPVNIGTDTNWKQVVTYAVNCACYTVALKTDGTLWAWGNNEYGQLGTGDNQSRTSPIKVGTDTNWKQIDAYSGIKADGTLWAWGNNEYGQLGTGDKKPRTLPTKIGTDTNWKQVVSRGCYAFGLRTDGTLWAWGYNQDGALGLGDDKLRTLPTKVGTDTNWEQIDACSGIKTDGTLWTWGNNEFGQLGTGDNKPRTSPTKVGIDANWKQVVAGCCIIAIKNDGTLWTWGFNHQGNLGLGDIEEDHRTSPTKIGTDTNWKFAASSSHAIAVKTDGTLWAWGPNDFGELGTGDNRPHSSPVKISLETMKK